jgi:hypothetical protein
LNLASGCWLPHLGSGLKYCRTIRGKRIGSIITITNDTGPELLTASM